MNIQSWIISNLIKVAYSCFFPMKIWHICIITYTHMYMYTQSAMHTHRTHTHKLCITGPKYTIGSGHVHSTHWIHCTHFNSIHICMRVCTQAHNTPDRQGKLRNPYGIRRSSYPLQINCRHPACVRYYLVSYAWNVQGADSLTLSSSQGWEMKEERGFPLPSRLR